MTTTFTEIDQNAQRLPEYLISDMYSLSDNQEVFDRVLERGGEAYLPELTAAYYLRPAYKNGTPPPETLREDHPLRQLILSADLDSIADPLQREVFSALQTSLHDREQGLPGVDENLLATRLAPGLIREHRMEAGKALLQDTMARLHYASPDLVQEVSSGLFSAAQEKLTEPDAQYVGSTKYLDFAFAAVNATEQSTVNDLDTTDVRASFVDSACDMIAKEGEPSPEGMTATRELLLSPIMKLRRDAQGQFMSDPIRAYKLVTAIAEHPRMKKMLQNPTSVLGDFIGVLNTTAAGDPRPLFNGASALITENYNQASKVAGTAQVNHYRNRVGEISADVAAIEWDPQVQALYEKFLQSTPSLSSKTEARALRIFKTMTRFGVEVAGGSEDLNVIEGKLIDALVAKLTDSNEVLTKVQRDRLLERFGAIDPLLIYATKFIGQDNYKAQLADLAKSVTANTYEKWRRGDGSPKDLNELIEAGYLPTHMTPQQYADWCSDGNSSSYEQLVNSVADTTDAIRNSVAMGSVDIADIAPGYSLDIAGLEAAVQDKNALGRLMGAVNKVSQGQAEGPLQSGEVQEIAESMGDLVRIPGIYDILSNLANGSDIGEVKQQIEGTRLQLEQLRLLIRLANVTPEEIAAGALLAPAGKDGKQRPQQQLTEVLSFLSNELPPQLRFIPESVAELLASSPLEQDESAIMLMSAEDTIDPKVTLEIGATPQRTCQHYESGGYNQGLIGYFGPEVKIGIVRNDKGNIIARSVVRLMEDEQGNAVLYAEPVYQSIVTPQVRTLLSEHFAKKAAKMGVELRGSLADGPQEPKTLKVRKLKMPAVYSDNGSTHVNTESLTVVG